MHAVFVYGTLKRGYPNHSPHLDGYRCLGRYRTVQSYPLVIGGRWNTPCLISEPGQGHRVFGELYEVDDAGLDALDRLEYVHLPHGYRRRRIAVEAIEDGGRLEAWTYLRERATIDGIHSGPMDDYPLDTGYVIPAHRPTDTEPRH